MMPPVARGVARKIIVGVGEIGVSAAPGDILKTFALGSCVAVIAFARRQGVAGLLHVALPHSKTDPDLALEKPGYFADTGIPALLTALAGYKCRPPSLVVRLVGGANIMDADQRFDIGRRNLLGVKKHLWRYQLGPLAEDVGGQIGRTVTVFVGTGVVRISSPGKGEWEL